MYNKLKENAAYLAWGVAVVGTVVSLYFSEILGFQPCVLCWYNRILLYPLVIILGVGIFKRDAKLHWYVLPFTVIGLVVSGYQSLLQWGLVRDFTPCSVSVPCTTKYVELFHFITIPFMAFIAFAAITVAMLAYRKIDHG